MKIIDFESDLGKTQAAFIVLFARDGVPWRSYSQDDPKMHNMKIPTCLMINRADGAVGFIGGKVESGENLEKAAIREAREEVGCEIERKLTPIIAHDIGSITTHLFALEIKYNELRLIQKEAALGEHFGSEVTGVFLPHLVDYSTGTGKEGGITSLLQNAMATSVREETIHFLLKMEIFNKAQLKIACNKAGYDLDKLLA